MQREGSVNFLKSSSNLGPPGAVARRMSSCVVQKKPPTFRLGVSLYTTSPRLYYLVLFHMKWGNYQGAYFIEFPGIFQVLFGQSQVWFILTI